MKEFEHKFDIEYAKLNKAQKEAVDAIEGPVMVIAGPGTGKTTILTLRIANILRLTDTPASGILALTFTEAGATNMRLKLREIMGGRADEVRIHTFHGFASSIIFSEFQDHFPHLSRTTQMTDVEGETLIREILKQEKFSKLRPFGEPDFYISKILGAIGDAKKEAWAPEMLKSFAQQEIERIKNDQDSISTRGATKGSLKAEALKRIEKAERTVLLSEVYEKYESKKKEERRIDFNDLLFELLKALREDKLLLQMLQEKFLYILLDEHQDTNETQNLIVKMIADFFESPNLFVVGDEKQAIYRFQGASVSNFLNFQKTWPSMKIISLTDNYRSHQSILDASFKMIEGNYLEGEYENLRIKLLSKNKSESKPIDIITAENVDAEEKYIAENVSQIIKENPAATIAIIVRRNREVEKLLALFEENNIEAKAERGADIFSHPVGILFFAFLEFLYDIAQTEFLAKTIAGGMWNLEFERRVELIKQIRKSDLQNLETEIPDLIKIKEELIKGGPISFLITAADLSGFTDMVKADPFATEVWKGILRLAESITLQNEIEDPKVLIERLLEYKKTAEHKTIQIVSGDTRAQVTIMTAHKSKGLEFDYVFIPKALEEIWIGRKRGSFFILPEEGEDDDVRDERRLFYVAITRAKKHAFITLPGEEGGKLLTPVRFISELDEAHIKHVDLPRYEKPLAPKTAKILENRKEKERNEYAKNVLLEDGISFTTLKHFLDSPDQFFEKCILKVPEPTNPSIERGKAMHEAISNVWRQIKFDKIPAQNKIEEIITTTIKNYFKKSFLPKYEKEPLVKELLEDARVVAECLVPHFQIPGQIFTEMNVESGFKSGGIDIHLKGRLDTVIEQENKILVFDYKTREGMSERAIRGETQSDDGHYFRQLAFYKLLLSENPRWKEKLKNKNLELSLVFIKPRPNGSSGRADSKDRCPTITLEVINEDIEKVKSEINTLLETVWSGSLLLI